VGPHETIYTLDRTHTTFPDFSDSFRARLYPFGRLTHRIGKAFYQGPWEFLGVALPQRHQKSRPAKELWGSSWKRCFERSGTRRGQESRIIIADREWVPRSALPAPCSEALIYPFRPKMAKVELRSWRRIFREGAQVGESATYFSRPTPATRFANGSMCQYRV
jgi:hypothetical protein